MDMEDESARGEEELKSGSDGAPGEAEATEEASTVAPEADLGAAVDSEGAQADLDPDMKWYAIHTMSGYEKKVSESLRLRFAQSEMSDRLSEILVPEEDVVDIRGGKRRVSKRKFFPGYILARMKMDERTWYLVKETPRVTGMLGEVASPSPLSNEEVVRLKDQMSGSIEKPRPKYAYSEGDVVRVIDGPFINFSGAVEEVNSERAKVKVNVLIFGRPTPVELSFSQVEKA